MSSGTGWMDGSAKADMDGTGKLTPMMSAEAGLKEAQLVVLRKAKRLAPSFHEHIVRSRIVGADVQAGGRFNVYDVVETQPNGRVLVTPGTKLEFI